MSVIRVCFFFFQAEDGIRDHCVTGVQTCALPISTDRPPLGLRLSLWTDRLPGWRLYQRRDASCRAHAAPGRADRESTRLNSSHTVISYAVFCLKKKKKKS